ncbi:hypothetical protein ACJJTC_016913 [Scirpophaga incertulas]
MRIGKNKFLHFLSTPCSIYVLLCVKFHVSVAFADYEDLTMRENFAQFNCLKLRSCTPSQTQVCGRDLQTAEMALFEDLCNMYQVNCKKKRYYGKVDLAICKNVADFILNEKDSLNFVHLNQSFTKTSYTDPTST